MAVMWKLGFGRLRLSTILFGIILVGLSVLLLSYWNRESHPRPDLENDNILSLFDMKEQRRRNWKRFHLDEDEQPVQQMCKGPTLSLKNDANRYAYHVMPPLTCGNGDLMYIRDGVLFLNHTVLGSRSLDRCEYRSISWVSDSHYTFSEPLVRKAPGPFEIILKDDFVHVECYLQKKYRQTNPDRYASQRKLLQEGAAVEGDVRVGRRRRINYPLEGLRKMEARLHHDRDFPHGQKQEDFVKGSPQNRISPNFSNSRDQTKVQTYHRESEKKWQVGEQNARPKLESQHHSEEQHKEKSQVLRQNSWQNNPQFLGSMALPDPPIVATNEGQHIKNRTSNIHGYRSASYIVQHENTGQQHRDHIEQLQQGSKTLHSDKTAKQNIQFTDNLTQESNRNQHAELYSQQDAETKPPLKPEDRAEASNLEHGKESPASSIRDDIRETDLETGNDDVGSDQDRYDTSDQKIDSYDADYPDFAQFVSQVVPQEEVLKRVAELHQENTNQERLNVLIFAVDSMSHLTYQRKLPKTYAHLKKLGAAILNGYNIVGDATTAAVIPLTTGRTEVELPEVRKNWPGSTYVDVYPFIWNRFEQQGYVTLYTEDQPHLGTFTLRFNGFEEVPTDHYARPFYQAVRESTLQDESPKFCLGSRPSHTYMLDYLDSFFSKYPHDIPKFCFGFLSQLSHDDNNPVEYLDEDFVQFLQRLESNNHLNNTLLVVMGDHGARYSKVRYTTQGKLEERLPMMSLTYPPWFQRKYPHLMRNLHQNTDRLTTPFDIHATLKSVLDLRTVTKPVKRSDRGISLLKEIPMNRTCESAGIDLHWCTCMVWQDMRLDSIYIQNAANALIEQLNALTESHRSLCDSLKLQAINDAKIGLPNEKVLKYLRSTDGDQRVANFSTKIKTDIFQLQLIVETTPGNGLFEGTVTMSEDGKRYQVAQEISRINVYGSQPHCIIDKYPELRKYCFCHIQKKTAKRKSTNRKES